MAIEGSEAQCWVHRTEDWSSNCNTITSRVSQLADILLKRWLWDGDIVVCHQNPVLFRRVFDPVSCLFVLLQIHLCCCKSWMPVIPGLLRAGVCVHTPANAGSWTWMSGPQDCTFPSSKKVLECVLQGTIPDQRTAITLSKIDLLPRETQTK